MRPRRDPVMVRRAVTVERIPDGTPLPLEPGTLGQVTQALGSHFTLEVEGQLVRLRGGDADAIGREPPQAPGFDGEGAPADLETRVLHVLATCYDPEIPVNILELGLVYACDLSALEDGRTRVAIQMTLTAPGCGMGDLLAEEVADKVLALDGVGEVKVDMVFDPPWDRSRMSEAAMLALGL
jgi:probable FeS assembly SUF system protein SufT